MSPLYALIEPAIVGGGVLLALGFTLRRFVPRRGGAAGGCSSGCSSCGGCGSAPASSEKPKPIVLHRQARHTSSSPPPGAAMVDPGFPPARE